MRLILDRSSAQTLIALGPETLTLAGRDEAWVAKLRDFVGAKRPRELIVGLGPGSFAGIRAAIACLQGLGIGWGIAPKGFPSAALLAYSAMRAQGSHAVTVVGDARRGTLWSVDYTLEAGQLLQRGGFRILAAERFTPTATMVSPDAERLARFDLRPVEACAEDLSATVEALGDALTCDPLPLYLHPAVGATPAE